jgi:drug/metabolite transporter (DMT)-like permease
MLRAGEALVALAPIFAAILLWAVVYRRIPSRRAVLMITLVEIVVAGAVIWQGTSEGQLAPHERYIPAQLQGGTVTDGHGG